MLGNLNAVGIVDIEPEMKKLRAILDKSPTCAESQIEPARQHHGEAVAARVAAYPLGMGLVELRVSGGIPP